MGEVIQLIQDDLKCCTYTAGDGEMIGLSMRDNSIQIVPLNKRDIGIVGNTGDMTVLSREELAEFIHVARILLDPEDKHLPTGELIGLDY